MVTTPTVGEKGRLRQELYEDMNDQSLSIADKQERALSIGLEYLDIQNGYIQRFTPDSEPDLIEASVGEDPEVLPQGTHVERATSYCRRTIESRSPIALSNASEQGWAEDPAFQEHGYECYIGTTIFVQGEIYGTVCFIAETGRELDFSTGEKEFIELLARLLGRAIEADTLRTEVAIQRRAKTRAIEKYDAFMELAPDAVLLLESETNDVVEANTQAALLAEYQVEELEDINVTDLLPDEQREPFLKLLDREDALSNIARFDDGEQIQIVTNDGTPIAVEISLKKVDIPDETLIQVVIRDISDRRERIERIERDREFMRQTQEAVNIGGWEYDLRSESLRVTDEVYRILGLGPNGDLNLQKAFDFFHPDDRSIIKHAFGRLTRQGEPFDLELRILTPKGDTRWVRTIGRPRYEEAGEGLASALGVFRNITDRVERERDLRLRSEAIEKSTVGITIGDAEQSDIPIIYANQGFTDLTGYPKERVIGQNCRFLQGEATDPETVTELREAIENEEAIRREILNYRADGTPFWNRLTIAPVAGIGGDGITHYVGVQDNISDEKRRDRLIEILNRVLRHNLRNDMNKVSGWANMISNAADEDISHTAQKIADTANELTALSEKAQQVRSVSEQSADLTPKDVLEQVQAVVETLEQQFPDIFFRIDAEETAAVMANDSLRIALQELGENAAKHGGGSSVKYQVETGDDDAVFVHVEDQGPGLPTQEQQVLAAGRETPLAHGSGLGLWLVNWIVTGIGGDISASVEDGTTITVRLPLYDEERMDATTQPQAALGNTQ
jgi:PAS domain S-box-containing protein